MQLGEDAALAGGGYVVKNISNSRLALPASESLDWMAEKIFTFHSTENGFDVECDLTLRRNAPGAASITVGVEIVINFLAPQTRRPVLPIGRQAVSTTLGRRGARRGLERRR